MSAQFNYYDAFTFFMNPRCSHIARIWKKCSLYGAPDFHFRPRDLNDTSYVFIMLSCLWVQNVIRRAGILHACMLGTYVGLHVI
jgi:hypothetical protein